VLYWSLASLDQLTTHRHMHHQLTELWFYVPLAQKYVISETFFPANLCIVLRKLNLTQQKQTTLEENDRNIQKANLTTTTTTVLRPFFRDYPGEPVSEENFWTSWCKGRLTDTDTPTIQQGATPSELTSADHHPPIFTGRMPFLSKPKSTGNLNPNQQSTLRTMVVCVSVTVDNCRTQYSTEQF